jgi:hypothetical protein
MNKRTRRRKTHRYALLMIRTGNWEIQRHAPVNFYKWCRKAQSCYLSRIRPDWTGCCNGVPWDMNGSERIYNRNARY